MSRDSYVPTCPSCRGAVPTATGVCPACGHVLDEGERYAPRPYYPDPSLAMGERTSYETSRPLIAGMALIIAGILEMASGAMVLLMGGTIGGLIGDGGVSDFLAIFGALVLIFGLIALIGGVAAVRKKYWPIAVVGGVVAIFGIGPSFLGTVLGLIGLALLVISRKEFEQS